MQGVMRVSVVATGIDVSQSETEMPLPRRRLSEPLSQTPVETSENTAPEAEQPEAAVEPDLFHPQPEPSEQQDSSDDWSSQRFGASSDDDLPPPAYQTAQEQQSLDEAAHRNDPVSEETPATPSQEALARLRSAVQHTPSSQASQPIEEEPAESERPRFGIGSLINRMSGAETNRDTASTRRQPQVQSDKAQEASDPQGDPSSPDQDRIEVPAFLRRQAN